MSKTGMGDWRELYDASTAFKKLAPWEWLDDSAMFAVERPATGEMGYCTVMGAAGMEYGLAMFLGDEGFDTYASLLIDDGGPEPDPVEVMLTMRSLSATFVDRKYLEREDAAVIRELGLRFRGAGAWPMFRSVIPGYLPWFLDPEEVPFLSMALRQAVHVTKAARSGAVRLDEWLSTGQVVTVTYEDGTPSFPMRDFPPPPVYEDAAPLDELQARRTKGAKTASDMPWEVDIFVLPSMIQTEERDRPMYAVVAMAVNASGLIMGIEMLEGTSSVQDRQDALIKILEKAPALPSAFHLGRREPADALSNISDAFGIPIYHASETQALDEAKEALIAALDGR